MGTAAEEGAVRGRKRSLPYGEDEARPVHLRETNTMVYKKQRIGFIKATRWFCKSNALLSRRSAERCLIFPLGEAPSSAD